MRNDSVSFKINLGRAGLAESAGSVYIHEARPTNSLATPKALRYEAPRSNIRVIYDSGNLRQVKAPEAFADIVTIISGIKYQVRLYHSNDVTNPSSGLFTTNGPAAYAVWTIENPDGSGTTSNQLRIVKVADGLVETNSFTWSDGDLGWTLVTGGGLRKEVKVMAIDAGNTNETETLSIKNESDQVVYKESCTFKLYPDPIGRRLIQKTVDPDTAALTSKFTYYDDYGSDGPKLGKPKLALEANGAWKRFEYDTNGRLSKEISVYLNGATNAAESSSRLLEFDYTPVDAGDDGAIDPDTPRRTIERLLGTEISRRYYVALPGERRQIQCQATGALATASANLVTTSKTYTNGNFAGRTKVVGHPDGTRQVFFYSSNDTHFTTTLLSGQADGSVATNVSSGTRTVTVTFLSGQPVSTIVYDISSQILLSSVLYTNFDSYKRALRVDYLDGTREDRTYSCCGAASVTNRDGTVVTYQYDGLKRVSSESRQITSNTAITTSFVYDPVGNVLVTTRTGTNGTGIAVAGTAYDLAGRLVRSTNAMQELTTYGEGIDANGQTVKTNTFPNTTKRIERYSKDGVLLSRTGDAVHGVRHTNGVQGAGVDAGRYFTAEIRLNTDGTDTSERTTNFVDAVGRSYKTAFADGTYSQSFYNVSGQLTNQTDPDGISTLLQYNARGELEYSVIDMDGDDTIDFAGTDRISQTISDVITNSTLGTNVTRVRTFVWSTSADSASLVSTREISTDGLRNWSTSFGLTNRTSTLFSGGHRYVTDIAPDDSFSVSDYGGERLLSVTRYDSATNQIGATTYTYDAHGRIATSTDARTGTTGYTYDDADRERKVTMPESQTTTNSYDNAGRIIRVGLPDGGGVTNVYSTRGELLTNYGARTYPVAYTYDYAGRLASMITWTNFAARQGAAATTWNYDSYRGFLTSKVYTDTTGPSYTYTAAGRLKTRTWARGVTTTYTTNAAGETAVIAYSDGTPGVTNTYDRLGRLVMVNQGTNVTAFVYNEAGQVLAETFNGLTVTNTYDSRLRRRSMGLSSQPSTLTEYGYDAASRLAFVTNGTHTASYSYLANSSLATNLVLKDGSNTRLTATKFYDNLNRLTKLTNMAGAIIASSHAYALNSANQHTTVTNSDGSRWAFAYDTLGQVTSGKRYWSDGAIVAGQQFEYGFDDIGNRQLAASGGDHWGTNLRYQNYTVNNVNQYTQRIVPGTIDVVGSATNTSTVTVNDVPTYRKSDYYRVQLTNNNSTTALYIGVTNLGVLNNGTNGDIVTNITGNIFLPQTPEALSYDADGNLTNDGRWAMTWDAENRLITMTANSTVPSAAKLKLDFAYDYRSRRTRKTVSTWNSSTYVPQSTNKFNYDDWNLIADLNPTNGLICAYVWGLDLSGTLQEAGGVGGLLAINSTTGGVHFAGYDGNGNVVTMADAGDGTVSATYDYGPFGEAIRSSGPAAVVNAYRFSTKSHDRDAELLYSDHRFYAPATGRWLSRDPIGERGGLNPYSFAYNNPQLYIDPFGLEQFQVVCNKAADLDRRIQGLRTTTGDQFKRVFMGLQSCILNTLCKGACCNTDDSDVWLNGTIDTFMTQFTDALDGNYYAENQRWRALLEKLDKLTPLTPRPEDMKYFSIGVPAGGSVVPLYVGTAFTDYATGVDTARQMALVHINQDLALALTRSGPGLDTDWKCIGGVVAECQKNFFTRLEELIGKLLPKDRFDIPFIRDQMRERIKKEFGQPLRPQ